MSTCNCVSSGKTPSRDCSIHNFGSNMERPTTLPRCPTVGTQNNTTSPSSRSSRSYKESLPPRDTPGHLNTDYHIVRGNSSDTISCSPLGFQPHSLSSNTSSFTTMHCFSLAALTILLMVVASKPLKSHDAQEFLTKSTSTSVSRTAANRQIHLGPQSTMIVEQYYLNGTWIAQPTEIEIGIESTAAGTTVCPSSGFVGHDLLDIKKEKRQVSTQGSGSTDEINLHGPIPSAPSVAWSLPTEHQVAMPTPTPISGCTTTVMGDLRNPCARFPKWTSTVTEYTAVDCHGCTSVYVLEPKWHCPVVITTVGPLVASGPSTLTSTICASTLAY